MINAKVLDRKAGLSDVVTSDPSSDDVRACSIPIVISTMMSLFLSLAEIRITGLQLNKAL